jgi:hypothetical protein
VNDFRNYSFSNLFSQTTNETHLESGVVGKFHQEPHRFRRILSWETSRFPIWTPTRPATPQTFRVNSGDPELVNDQIETSAFVDGDLKVTRQFIRNVRHPL